jgi:hypothetical protein
MAPLKSYPTTAIITYFQHPGHPETTIPLTYKEVLLILAPVEHSSLMMHQKVFNEKAMENGGEQ